jgi:predicted ATPase/DNA-binding CsgD family transcriptional regulator
VLSVLRLAPLPRMFGRDDEVEQLVQLVERVPLVTLTGLGGSGKTTLALHVASQVAGDFPDGVFWVELAELRDPALVVAAFAESVGIEVPVGRPLLESLCAELGSSRCLLVLDNCEHLLDATRDVVVEVTRRCPQVRLLATSRDPFELPSERAVRVPPLPVPDATSSDPREVGGVAAVQLFVARARAADTDFDLTPATAPLVARICRRTEGLPLALELLASRLVSTQIEELLTVLDTSLEFDETGGCDPPDRRGSVGGSIAWTFRMLSDEERLLLLRLSVFAGGWNRGLARSVCADDALPADVVDEIHASLERRALVQAHPTPGRYRLLEPIRAFASRRLVADGEAATVAERFVTACRTFIAEQLPERPWSMPPDTGALARLAEEHANLLAAIHLAEQHGQPAVALTMTTRLWTYWRVRGHIAQGRVLTERLLPAVDEVEPEVQADALLAATAFAQSASDLDRAEELVGRSLQRVRELDDDFGHGTALALLANIAAGRGDVARAIDLYRQARDIARRMGRSFGEALILTNLGLVLAESGELASARAGLEEAEELLEATGDVWFRAYVLTCLSQLVHRGGDRSGGHELALRSAELLVDLGGGPELAEALEHLADLAADQGAAAVGVQLHGAAQRARDDSGAHLPPARRRAVIRRRDELRSLLGNQAYDRHWTTGQQLTPAAAIALVRDGLPRQPRPSRDRRVAAWPLTDREFEVAEAVAAGLTNKQTADLLHIAPGTVKTHVQNALTKLGFGTRTELGVWAAGRSGAYPHPRD